tara:strand:+ start:470 stop:1627 length:1158 start_codon:yes stop_codon:yes gene_type:complete
MKNIIHFTHTSIYYDNRVLKELESVSKIKNAKVCGIGSYNPTRDKNSPSTIKKKFNFEIKTIRLFSDKLRLSRLIKILVSNIELNFKFIKEGLKKKPSIIHIHDIPSLPSGIILKKLLGCKLIYDAHELEAYRQGSNYLLSKITLIIESLAWPNIDYFITVSNSIEKYYLNNFGKKKSTVIFNSPEINIPKLNKEFQKKKYFHDKYNIDYERKIFIYVGCFVEGRSIKQLIKCFKKISPLPVNLIFIGYGELENVIRKACSENQNIHMHQKVNIENLIKTIRHADYGICMIEPVSLSDRYSLPNKLFEYAFAGLKIISSNLPDIKEVTQKYNLGLTCNNSEDSLIKIIKKIIIKEESIKAKNLDQLSWASQSIKLNQIYKNLLEH